MLKSYISIRDDGLDADALIRKYREELEMLCTPDKDTKDSFGLVNTWWVFGEVSNSINYSVLMAEADHIGYKRTKRGEREMPNDLYRYKDGKIIIDDGNEDTILDHMRKINWE